MWVKWKKCSMNILLNISVWVILVCNVTKWFLAERFLYFVYSNNRKAIWRSLVTCAAHRSCSDACCNAYKIFMKSVYSADLHYWAERLTSIHAATSSSVCACVNNPNIIFSPLSSGQTHFIYQRHLQICRRKPYKTALWVRRLFFASLCFKLNFSLHVYILNGSL